jgi:hypothetical protein
MVQLTRLASEYQQLWVIHCTNPEESGQHTTPRHISGHHPHQVPGRGTVQYQGVVADDGNGCTIQNYTIRTAGASYNMEKNGERTEKLDKAYLEGSINPAQVVSVFMTSSSNKHLNMVHKGRVWTPWIHPLHHPGWMADNEHDLVHQNLLQVVLEAGSNPCCNGGEPPNQDGTPVTTFSKKQGLYDFIPYLLTHGGSKNSSGMMHGHGLHLTNQISRDTSNPCIMGSPTNQPPEHILHGLSTSMKVLSWEMTECHDLLDQQELGQHIYLKVKFYTICD